MAVVVLDCHLGAVKTAEKAAPPVSWIKQFANQCAFNALPQENLFVIAKGLVAKQAIVGGGETAARYRADAVDLIKQSDPVAAGILQSADGKVAKIKCGPEVRNFAQIRVGDEVKTSLLETVELFVTGNNEPAAERVTEVARAPLGSKPGFAAIDAVEVKASVVAINYQTRKVTLKGPEGKIINVTAGDEVKRLNEFKVGDSVVARLTRAVSIEVSKPAKN